MARWAPSFRWLLTLPISVFGQYDFPVDSCACHIFYEHWVQMQLVISKVLTPDFPEKALDETSGVREALAFDSCQDLRKVKNSLAWTVSTAAQTDCSPGQMSTFIMCSQLALLKNDFELALMYSEIANYQLPFASNCMDPGQWTLRPEDVLHNHRKMLRFSLEVPDRDLTPDQVKHLLWQPVTGFPTRKNMATRDGGQWRLGRISPMMAQITIVIPEFGWLGTKYDKYVDISRQQSDIHCIVV
ncbi:unnamed protein product [Cladocopium goreaui]|uniref:Uncharacterized protein n=1 Tax=Cladocopium goreaui TaxID=2562237 RepID=A0A9P1CM75_9DINO|nr:unnamed protein product [Cladocopium goreaui]